MKLLSRPENSQTQSSAIFPSRSASRWTSSLLPTTLDASRAGWLMLPDSVERELPARFKLDQLSINSSHRIGAFSTESVRGSENANTEHANT
jgi:hypothetical protein